MVEDDVDVENQPARDARDRDPLPQERVGLIECLGESELVDELDPVVRAIVVLIPDEGGGVRRDGGHAHAQQRAEDERA